MARVSKAQAQTNHRVVVENSARLIRERGIDGMSVAGLMESAGLTHGGFYGHFDSKEQLAVHACGVAFDQSVDCWATRLAEAPTPEAGFKAIVDGYLSARNRDDVGISCPAPALASDVARMPVPSAIRDCYRDGVERLLDTLRAVQPLDDSVESRRLTLVQFALMVGALALSRATMGDPLSEAFLDSAREALTDPRAPCGFASHGHAG